MSIHLLYAAVRENNVEEAEKLIERGVDVDAKIDFDEWDGATVLAVAACFDTPEMVEVLIKHHADVNSRDINGNTPLHLAACSDSDTRGELVIPILIDGGADVNAKNWRGKRPLQLTDEMDYRSGRTKVIAMLKRYEKAARQEVA